MKLPKLQPDPNNFLPGEKISLWRDPAWSQVTFMVLAPTVFLGDMWLSSMHKAWAYVAFAAITLLFIGNQIYFGFIRKAALMIRSPGVIRGKNAEKAAIIEVIGILLLALIILGVSGSL